MKIDQINDNTITIDDSSSSSDNSRDIEYKANNQYFNKVNKKCLDRKNSVKEVATIITNNKNVIPGPISPQNLSNLLIVFDEVDILMEQDKGFWASVYNILKSTKRPILFTGNGKKFEYFYFYFVFIYSYL